MKKLLIASLLTIGLAADVQAQDSEHRHTKSDGSRIAKHLDVTEDQLPAFQAVMQEQAEKRRALHQEFREKNQELETETRSELEGVLTGEQMEKLNAMKESRRNKWKDDGKQRIDHHRNHHLGNRR